MRPGRRMAAGEPDLHGRGAPGGPGAAARSRWGGDELHLTPTEYKLLTTLIRHAGKVITHRQLLREVWGPNAVDQTHYLRVYMAQLRHKIEEDPARPRLLTTESGVGYRLRLE